MTFLLGLITGIVISVLNVLAYMIPKEKKEQLVKSLPTSKKKLATIVSLEEPLRDISDQL